MKFERKSPTLPKRILLQALFAVTACASVPAFAGIDVDINVGPPPPPRVEVVPVAPAGQVWAPGFWEYAHGQYVWRRGHFQAGRPGYHWVPEAWDRRGDHHHFEEGHWEREHH
jgi:hypothetical protein